MCLREFWWLDKFGKCSSPWSPRTGKNSQLVLLISTLVRGKFSPTFLILIHGIWGTLFFPQDYWMQIASSGDGGLMGVRVLRQLISESLPSPPSLPDGSFFSLLLGRHPSIQLSALSSPSPSLTVFENRKIHFASMHPNLSLLHMAPWCFCLVFVSVLV